MRRVWGNDELIYALASWVLDNEGYSPRSCGHYESTRGHETPSGTTIMNRLGDGNWRRAIETSKLLWNPAPFDRDRHHLTRETVSAAVLAWCERNGGHTPRNPSHYAKQLPHDRVRGQYPAAFSILRVAGTRDWRSALEALGVPWNPAPPQVRQPTIRKGRGSRGAGLPVHSDNRPWRHRESVPGIWRDEGLL